MSDGYKVAVADVAECHCFDDVAERVNGILKQEYWLDENFETKPEARKATVQGVDLYNNRRPHTALGFKTPGMVHDGGTKN